MCSRLLTKSLQICGLPLPLTLPANSFLLLPSIPFLHLPLNKHLCGWLWVEVFQPLLVWPTFCAPNLLVLIRRPTMSLVCDINSISLKAHKWCRAQEGRPPNPRNAPKHLEHSAIDRMEPSTTGVVREERKPQPLEGKEVLGWEGRVWWVLNRAMGAAGGPGQPDSYGVDWRLGDKPGLENIGRGRPQTRAALTRSLNAYGSSAPLRGPKSELNTGGLEGWECFLG
ncbi:hypothetical protein BKA70DRAFT_1218372 [Coprinopsis sp. MPI-PUGE-AT-0042]|nr:hypothetical protein BKA70DRAFT_1218372 [Coprinopsis sp. MPI-PUGE-AT-0042]